MRYYSTKENKLIKLETKKFSNPKLKLKQRSGRFLLEIHKKVRCKSAPKVWPQWDIDTVLCLFKVTVTQMQEYNQITAGLD